MASIKVLFNQVKRLLSVVHNRRQNEHINIFYINKVSRIFGFLITFPVIQIILRTVSQHLYDLTNHQVQKVEHHVYQQKGSTSFSHHCHIGGDGKRLQGRM